MERYCIVPSVPACGFARGCGAKPQAGHRVNFMLPDYLNPNVPLGLKRVLMPMIEATPKSLQGYGRLVESPDSCRIEIVRWPAAGWRPVDPDTGDEAGTKQGTFVSEWRGDVLYGRNEAVGGHYILAYAAEPATADESHTRLPERILLWHANYHPDGGQLFFPLDRQPFVVPLALPGDDVTPEHFVCFRFDGSKGLYIHPNIWHEGVFTLRGRQRFFDQQGTVHARVSVDFPREFQCLLEAKLSDERSLDSVSELG
jgi:Ureidoglycolate lyase